MASTCPETSIANTTQPQTLDVWHDVPKLWIGRGNVLTNFNLASRSTISRPYAGVSSCLPLRECKSFHASGKMKQSDFRRGPGGTLNRTQSLGGGRACCSDAHTRWASPCSWLHRCASATACLQNNSVTANWNSHEAAHTSARADDIHRRRSTGTLESPDVEGRLLHGFFVATSTMPVLS